MNNPLENRVVLSDEVATALHDARPVVALETTIVVQGLPAPINLDVARDCDQAVRKSGAVPATIGLLNGNVVVGLSAEELEQLASPERNAAKLSSRDLGLALASGRDGATTVAGTIALARYVGIDVMATGGLGGVHRGAAQSFDESADLTALSRTPVLVVASGVKSILDIGATLERLDSLGVPVVGYRTTSFPGFYRSRTDFALDWSLGNAEDVARAFLAHRLFSPTGMLVANPVAEDQQLDAQVHDHALDSALALSNHLGVTGKEVTPVLLAEFARVTAGQSVQVNRELVVANAELAGRIALALVKARP
ncbi:MAG: pseudouridine-5'-phosphate glycosidase [Acidimicrobiales bacterium]